MAVMLSRVVIALVLTDPMKIGQDDGSCICLTAIFNSKASVLIQ